MTGPKLEVKELTKTYGSTTAVENLSVTVEPGEFTSLLGASGCGKSTTLRCIAGLERPDSGRIIVGDTVVSAPADGIFLPPERREISMMFQTAAVWPHMTVRENVQYPLEVGTGSLEPGESPAERVEEMLDLVGLSSPKGAYPTQLSGGQRRRVALARALAVRPAVLLLDEPLASLDAGLRHDLRRDIRRLCDEIGTTVLYVTHSQDTAMYVSDRIALMSPDGIVEQGEPTELYSRPTTMFGMKFLGEYNALDGELLDCEGMRGRVRTTEGVYTGTLATGVESSDTSVVLCFRPEACRLLERDATPPDGTNTLTGTVTATKVRKGFFETHVETNDATVTVRTDFSAEFDVGQSVQVTITPERTHVYPA